MTTRTRMAPSPTGEYHIGGMRTLLYNYALAKKEGGQFLLRIEDTDRERHVQGAAERLIKVIKDYGLSWDEGPEVGGSHGPYVQSERLEIYKNHAKELVSNGHAYYCFCSKERLESLREEQRSKGVPSTKYDKHCLNLSKEEINKNLESDAPYVIRLNVKPDQEIVFRDLVLGEIKFPSSDIDDQVLLKSDGYPTYHLAVVVDDYLMKISHVMRGVEWLPSTPKHILLYRAFGWELPAYAHLPLLKEKGDTKKLSKRMGSVAAEEFLAEGFLPEALLNFLMFLGWNPGTEKEMYTLEEFVQDFSIQRIHKSDLVVFDREKLAWMNSKYIKNLKCDPVAQHGDELYLRLLDWATKYDKKLKILENADKNQAVWQLFTVQDRLIKFSEVEELTNFYYQRTPVTEEMLLKYAGSSDKVKSIASLFYELLDRIDSSVFEGDWNRLDSEMHSAVSEKGWSNKEAFMTLRVILSGKEATPPLSWIIIGLRKKVVLDRLREYI